MLRKPARFLILAVSFLVVILLSLPLSAKEEKPKPKSWEISGIVAALEDERSGVGDYAIGVLATYDKKALKSLVTVEQIQTLSKIFEKKKADAAQRVNAASALTKMGYGAKVDAKSLVDILKDKEIKDSARGKAALTLGDLGNNAKPYVKDLAAILKGQSSVDLRGDVAVALWNLGDTAKPHIKDVFAFLKNEQTDLEVRRKVSSRLGNLENTQLIEVTFAFLRDEQIDLAVRQNVSLTLRNLENPQLKIEAIFAFIQNEQIDGYVRRNVALALGNLKATANLYVKDITAILNNKEEIDDTVRGGIALALGNFGDDTQPYAKDIATLLNDKEIYDYVRGAAAVALGTLGKDAQPYIKDIAAMLNDTKLDDYTQSDAAQALSSLGKDAQPYIKDMLAFLKNEKLDKNARSDAAETLWKLGDTAEPYIKEMLAIINDEKIDESVRSNLVYTLWNLEDVAKPYVKDIVAILQNEKMAYYVRVNAAWALSQLDGKLGLENIIYLLDTAYEEEGAADDERARAYFYSGGDEQVKRLLNWVVKPKRLPEKIDRDEAIKTLEALEIAWKPSEKFPPLRADLAEQTAKIVSQQNVRWKTQDLSLLKRQYDNLKSAKMVSAAAVQGTITGLEGPQWLLSMWQLLLAHAIFWCALIFFYPTSPQIQAIFFWNPWVRNVLGVGYVTFLLQWLPFLRRKLFKPFRGSLLADAGLDHFNPDLYFPDSEVSPKDSDQTQPLTAAFPSINGQIVLEGESGLGKTMFLRHLLKQSKRIVVYLPATKCADGVMEAIQKKLHGDEIKDPKFLQSLIYSGAIDICIDGLDEVSADTRAKITQFVESLFRGNILIATQPLEWTPPATAKTYQLHPLRPDQIEQYLLSRQPFLPKNLPVHGIDYTQTCQDFLHKMLGSQMADEERKAAQTILSNPMELTLAAGAIAAGTTPDLFHLRKQQYTLMATDYQKRQNQIFPLKPFSELVYQLRLTDKRAIPPEDFFNELCCMEDEKFRMVVSRQWQNAKGGAEKEWYFRHDKIAEFFIAQTFLGESDEAEKRLVDHMGDARFRGVYFLLATLMPEAAAKQLREDLIRYAAETKDHNVSDDFVLLFNARRAVRSP